MMIYIRTQYYRVPTPAEEHWEKDIVQAKKSGNKTPMYNRKGWGLSLEEKLESYGTRVYVIEPGGTK